MFLKDYVPSKSIRPYINRIYIAEFGIGEEKNALKLLTPNGKIKLIIPYMNGFFIVKDNKDNNVVISESICTLICQSITSGRLEYSDANAHICVEFNSAGAYKFFDLQLSNLIDRFAFVSDILNVGSELQERIYEIRDIDKKVHFIEKFLHKQMISLNKNEPIVEYAVKKIIEANGLMQVHELIKEIGCSSKHLSNKFNEYVGICPKTLSSIIRFNKVYNALYRNDSKLKEDLYCYYYDYSHFIKEFKKYTGLTPHEYKEQDNIVEFLL